MYNLKKASEIEDLTKPEIVEISAEQRIEDNYLGILHNLDLMAQGAEGDKEESEIAYQSIKMVLKELSAIKEKLDNKKSIDILINKFKKLMNEYFGARYAKETQKEDKPKSDFSNLPPAPPPPSAPAPSPASPAPAPAPPPPTAFTLNKFRKIATMLAPESYDPREFLNDEIKREAIDEYATRACHAILNKHTDIKYSFNIDNGEIKIFDAGMLILKIQVNEYLNITSIVPANDLQEIYPYHTLEFYQKYWKPIVESIGHFCLSGTSTIIVVDRMTLPDAPKTDKNFTIECWNNSSKQKENMDISFCGENPTWLFKPSSRTVQASTHPSKYIETDYANAIVKCIDPNLKTIIGRTGAVVQVMPLTDIIEIDVDFGRGLGVIRLTEDQIEIVPLKG